MATRNQTGSDAELRPFRDPLALPGASPADRFIALGLSALYPSDGAEEAEQAALASGWSRLADSARKVARRRRRAYLLRELLRSWNLRPRQLFVAAFALALIFAPVERRGMQTVPYKVLVAPRVALTAESQELRLLGGAEVQVEHGAVEIDQRDRGHTRIALTRGQVRLQVPPIPDRGRLVVETSDAAVIVHGTRFTVRKLDAASTAVAVEEGLVEVRPLGGSRPPIFLRPRESTVVKSLGRYLDELMSRARSLVEAQRCDDPDGVLDRALELAPEGSDPSAIQYLKGFCAAQRKDNEAAIRWFEEAARTSPDSVRADNALARAARLRAERSAAEGAAAWHHYLERFPQGLHREMAERSLSPSSPASPISPAQEHDG